jgi:hypothetical protein
MFKRVAAVLAGLLCLLAAAGPASADGSNSATLTVTPNPVTAYYAGELEATGCGYSPGDWVDLFVTPPGAAFPVEVGAGPVDTAGCVRIVSSGWVAGPGEYPVEAAHQVQTGQTVKQRPVAGTVLTVI